MARYVVRINFTKVLLQILGILMARNNRLLHKPCSASA